MLNSIFGFLYWRESAIFKLSDNEVYMKYSLIVMIALLSLETLAQKTIPLYDGKIPGAKNSPDVEKTEYKDGVVRVSNISVPTISIFPAPKQLSNGTAIIVFPGGGYRINALSHEGMDVAKKLNELGITAFVVKYRIPNDATMEKREIGPLQDAQQAIRLVREHATEWEVNPDRIGIMGFSAGGHLASTLGTHYSTAVIDNEKQTRLRPDFMVLVYPVISFADSITHQGSRDQLIGKNPPAQKVRYFSNELQVTADTPPAFIVHAGDDKGVSVKNSLFFYERLIRFNVPAELHVYENGGHGFGMENSTTTDRWMDRLAAWLRSNQMIR
jgi:acetyl esterase/lipase